jgi:hypothetical protein
MTMTGAQCLAARRLLGWSRIRLTLESGIASGVIKVFEINEHVPPREVTSVLRRTLKSAGVIFGEGERPEVRLRRAK